MNETFSYLLYSAAWKITQFLPKRIAYGLFRWLADRMYKSNPSPVKRLRSNYRRVHPDYSIEQIDLLVQQGLRSYLRYWCDTFRFPSWSKESVLTSVVVENERYLREPLAAGRGVIVALPHSGNWDHAGAYFCFTGAPLVTVAEHLKPEKLFHKFLAFREAIGMEVLDASARSFATLSQRLGEGRLIALVADRDLSKSGVEIAFFRAPARMPAGPALLAIKTGAALITAYVRYEGDGIHIQFGPEIEVPDEGSHELKIKHLVQRTADVFADQISQSTADWHMLQRIWVDGDFRERS